MDAGVDIPEPGGSDSPGVSRDGARLRRAVPFLLLLVLAVGLLARSWHLASWPALHGDEAINGVMAERLIDLHSATVQRTRDYFSLLFPHLLVPCIHAFGRTTLALRILPLLSGLLSIVAIYATALRLFDRRRARVAAACMAILPIGITFGRFGWDVNLLPGIVALAFYLAVVAWQNRSISAAAGAGLCMAIGTWLHPTGLLVPVSVAAAALATGTLRKHLREAAIIAIIAATCSYTLFVQVTSPQLPAQRDQGVSAYRHSSNAESRGEWSSPWSLTLAATNALKTFDYLTGMTPAGFLLHLEGPAAFAARAAGMLAWAIILAAALKCGTPGRALLAYVATFFICSHLANPGFLNIPSKGRYLLALAPVAPLLLACVIGAKLPSRTWAAAAVTTLFACWFGVACMLLLYAGRGQTARVEMMTTAEGDPKKLAADYLLEHADPGHDIVVAGSWWTYWPLVYYSSGRLQVFTADDMIADTTVADPDAHVRRVWYVRLSDTRGREPPLESALLRRWIDPTDSSAELRLYVFTDTRAATEWLKAQWAP